MKGLKSFLNVRKLGVVFFCSAIKFIYTNNFIKKRN